MRNTNKITAEYSQGSWAFIDPFNPSNRVKFDQCIMDATNVREHRVEGFVKAVHGIDQALCQYFDRATREDVGITPYQALANPGSRRRVRLMEGGTVEDARND